MTKPKTPETTDNQITDWDLPQTKLHSQWGFIRYDAWCDRELARITSLGCAARVRSENGMICLARGKA